MAHRKRTNKLKNPPSKWKDKLLEEGPKSFMQAILYEQLKKGNGHQKKPSDHQCTKLIIKLSFFFLGASHFK